MALPEYELTPLEGGYTVVECPRAGCGARFTIEAEVLLAGRAGAVGVGTRPCPACFRAARLPE